MNSLYKEAREKESENSSISLRKKFYFKRKMEEAYTRSLTTIEEKNDACGRKSVTIGLAHCGKEREII